MNAKAAPLLLLGLCCYAAYGASAYVSDDLVLGVYAEPNGQGQRLTTLHSGATVESLAVKGESTQVRLADGTLGWVKSTYLTTRVPATTRVKQLEAELDGSRAVPPALAEAAARSEVERLQRELAALHSHRPVAGMPDAPAAARVSWWGRLGWPAVLGCLALLGLGFWLGYATLALRIRHKFGGIKVY